MTRHWITRRLLIAGLGASAPTLAAQAGNQDPAPIRAISAEGGYAIRFGTGAENEGYYRITYKGKPVREKGTPFKSARSLDLLAPVPQKASGDVPALAFRYENARAAAGGGLLEALGAQQLPLPGLDRLGLRGIAHLGADAKFDHVQAAVGLETPPARVPGLAASGISNWIVIGLNAERREATDSEATDVNLALATFRSFVGKAVGWRKSADVGHTAAKIVHDLLEAAPTRTAALALQSQLDSIPANQRTSLQQILLDALPESQSDADWEETLKAMSFGEADAITDQPTAAIFGEWSGWVDLASHPSDRRFKSLLTASLDYWFLPGRDDVLVRVRYELGYERANPGPKKNQLLLSIGLRL